MNFLENKRRFEKVHGQRSTLDYFMENFTRQPDENAITNITQTLVRRLRTRWKLEKQKIDITAWYLLNRENSDLLARSIIATWPRIIILQICVNKRHVERRGAHPSFAGNASHVISKFPIQCSFSTTCVGIYGHRVQPRSTRRSCKNKNNRYKGRRKLKCKLKTKIARRTWMRRVNDVRDARELLNVSERSLIVSKLVSAILRIRMGFFWEDSSLEKIILLA